MIGTKLGTYEITRPLGKGGMGEVYLARDSKLDRDVAVKVLPETVVRDPERIARFEREAKLLASLNHPNIAGVFGFDESGGMRFLVMEYVEGHTLSDRLDAGPLPVDEALEIAQQIAEALEEAHERGIVHRDLKPGNVMITPDGKVKVLDFGLAKAMSDDSSSMSTANSPTITANFTRPGVVLGTAAYMSPEQARGRTVDKRTDIWSFGVVLYEMLTGVCPFRGETVSDSIGAILNKDIDETLLPDSTSVTVKRVLTRCLERDRKRRLRDIGDARLDLDADDQDASNASTSRTISKQLLVGLVVIGLVPGVFVGVAMNRNGSPRVVATSIEPPPNARILFSGDLAGPPVVSPDGTMVAFVAASEGSMRKLWLRRLDDSNPQALRGTEGALYPFWSPDSREIGFFTVREMHRFDLGSNTVQRICNVDQARGGTWTEDGRILYSPSFRNDIWSVPSDGGTPQRITERDSSLHSSHRWPFAIPGTPYFLFTAVNSNVIKAEHNGIYIGRLDSPQPPRRLMDANYRAEYVAGHILFVRDRVLLASKVDLDAAVLEGNPIAISGDIAPDLSTWHGQFSASDAGLLVFNRLGYEAKSESSLVGYSWAVEGDRVSIFDHTGRRTTAHAVGLPIFSMALSPDGMTLALAVVTKEGTPDIWLHPTAWVEDIDDPKLLKMQGETVMAPQIERLTFLRGSEIAPVWSPQSDEIAFRWSGDEDHPPGIYRKRIGGGTEILVRDNKGKTDYPNDWTSDGKYIIFVTGHWITSDSNDIWAISLEDGTEIELVAETGSDRGPRVSPDGRWLAYKHKDESHGEIYVIPFAPAWPEATGNRKWRVSNEGGHTPRWSREGDELYFISESGMLMSAAVDLSGESFSFQPARQLFQSPWDIGRTFDPTPDTKTQPNGFMFLDGTEGEDAPISVILNWQQLLVDN